MLEQLYAVVLSDNGIGFLGNLSSSAKGGQSQVPEKSTEEATSLPSPFGLSTANLGVLRLDDCGCYQVELDIRYNEQLSEQFILDELATCFADLASLELIQSKPLHLVELDSPSLEVLQSSYEAVTGERLPAICMGGGTYASYLPGFCAFGPKLPGRHSGAHGVNEHVVLEDIPKVIKIYSCAIVGLVELAVNDDSKQI